MGRTWSRKRQGEERRDNTKGEAGRAAGDGAREITEVEVRAAGVSRRPGGSAATLVPPLHGSSFRPDAGDAE